MTEAFAKNRAALTVLSPAGASEPHTETQTVLGDGAVAAALHLIVRFHSRKQQFYLLLTTCPLFKSANDKQGDVNMFISALCQSLNYTQTSVRRPQHIGSPVQNTSAGQWKLHTQLQILLLIDTFHRFCKCCFKKRMCREFISPHQEKISLSHRHIQLNMS